MSNNIILFQNILVVCIGNICRSPMAEALFWKHLSDNGTVSEYTVESAGLGALVGCPADKIAQHLMLQRGIDISAHRARQLNSEIIHRAGLVLVMDTEQKRELEADYPSVRGRVYRLGEWGNFDVPDPYRQSDKAFEHALELILRGVYEWKPKLGVN